MVPTLSRRLAAVISAPDILDLVKKDYDKFFKTIREAETFEQLPEDVKQTIKAVEKENKR